MVGDVRKGDNRVIMDIQFTVPLDFVVYEHQWNIHIYQDLDIFLF